MDRGAGHAGRAGVGLGGDAVDGVREDHRDELMPYGVDTIRLRISFPAGPVSGGYNGRAWKMRPLRGWTGGQAAGGEGFIAGEGIPAEAPELARSDNANLFAGPGAPADDLGQRSDVDVSQYSRSKPGYHHYPVNDVVASAAEHVTVEEMRDQMLRFAIPGRSPDQPVASGGRYLVYDPVTGLFVGNVMTTVSEDGLTTVNRTVPGHLLADGAVVRTASHNPDGSWSVKAIGLGNNVDPELAPVNEFLGPYIFTNLDMQMRQNIQGHHGAP